MTRHTQQQLKSYLETNNYRCIQKDKRYSFDSLAGLWVADGKPNDGDDADAVAAFMREREGITG